jgi:hypothetical protein
MHDGFTRESEVVDFQSSKQGTNIAARLAASTAPQDLFPILN